MLINSANGVLYEPTEEIVWFFVGLPEVITNEAEGLKLVRGRTGYRLEDCTVAWKMSAMFPE